MATNLLKIRWPKRMWKTNWKNVHSAPKNTTNQSSTWLSTTSVHIPSFLATVTPLLPVYTNGLFERFTDIAWQMTFVRHGHIYGRTGITKEDGSYGHGLIMKRYLY